MKFNKQFRVQIPLKEHSTKYLSKNKKMNAKKFKKTTRRPK